MSDPKAALALHKEAVDKLSALIAWEEAGGGPAQTARKLLVIARIDMGELTDAKLSAVQRSILDGDLPIRTGWSRIPVKESANKSDKACDVCRYMPAAVDAPTDQGPWADLCIPCCVSRAAWGAASLGTRIV